MTKHYEEGNLRIWWIPQIPGDPFYYDVDSEIEGAKMLILLGTYDNFQYIHNIKPDYANTGGMEVYENDEWVSWESSDGEYDDPVRWYENF